MMMRDNFKCGDAVVVATSGGPDSMALLHLVLSLRDELGLDVVCAHVNHKLRLESDDEESMVMDFCASNGLSCEVFTISDYNDGNVECDARNQRYAFFERVVKKCKAGWLLTAHHGDDLMETILMRLTRGSSLLGYAGFREITCKDGYKIMRPLIFYTKDFILDYVEENGIPYAVDETNLSDDYTRNRIRHHILPLLKRENKNVHRKFYDFSSSLLMNGEYISLEVNRYLSLVYVSSFLKVSAFLKLDKAIQIGVMNAILDKVYGDDITLINRKHMALIFDILNSPGSNKRVSLPLGKEARRSYDDFVIRDKVLSDDYRFVFDDYLKLDSGRELKRVASSSDTSNYVTRISSSEVSLPLYVRNRRKGDVICVKGLNGSKKLKDVLIDSKVPLALRNVIPVVVDSKDEIIWLPGIKKTKFDKQKDENYDIIIRYY